MYRREGDTRRHPCWDTCWYSDSERVTSLHLRRSSPYTAWFDAKLATVPEAVLDV